MRVDRRTFLRRTLQLGAGLSVTGLGTLPDGPRRAGAAEEKVVYFLSWGGTIQTMLEKEGWAQKFEKETGTKVILVPKATSAEIIATALAQKEKPQVDVVMCDLPGWLLGEAQAIFDKLNPADMPNLSDIYPVARVGDVGVSLYGDTLAILYQTELFKKNNWATPKSWSDLLRPELRGWIIIPPLSNTYGVYALVELARLKGGGEKNIGPGFEQLKALAPGVVDWSTTFAKIGELFQGGEAAIAVFGNASGFELKRKGLPIEVVNPDPIYLSPTTVGIMKNAPHPQSARVFMNWLIGKDVITYRAERFLQAPMNSKVRLKGDVAKMVVMGEDTIRKLKNLDWRSVLPQRARWIERFDKEVATIPRAR